MTNTVQTRYLLSAVAGMVVMPMAANAQAMSVGPVNIQLAPGQATASLTVENPSSEPTNFQVRAFAWSEKDGQDQLVRTDALVASPPLGTVAPHGKQLIRLVLREKPAAKESTYRIWLDQIPSAKNPGAVRIALRFSIPVFAEPEAAAMPDVRWQITRKGAQLYLIGNNMGAEHETIRKLVLKEADGKVIGTDDNASPHILAGAERSWRISATKLAPGSALRLTAETDGPSIDQSIRLPSGSP